MQISPAKKAIITFLAIAMLMPGVYLAFRPVAPVQAQITEIFSVTNAIQWVLEAVVAGVETAVYKTLKNLAKSLAHKMVETGLEEFATGKKGQEPFWSTKAWESDMKDLADNAIGFAVEGAAKGFEKSMQRSQKVYDEGKMNEASGEAERRQGIANRASTTAKTQTDAGKKTLYEKTAKFHQDKADASAEKAKDIKAQLDAADKNADKRAEADRRGQAGATSDEVASAINFMCTGQFNAGISLRISLGMGSLGEDPDATPPCKGSDLAKNWGAMYDQFSSLDPEKINMEAWSALASTFDTESTDVGVAFNANSAFYDAHEKKVAANSLESFIQRIAGKDQTDEAGNIKTPGDIIRNKVKTDVVKGEENSTDPVKGMTGKFTADMADVVATFVDSLASKGMDYLKKGMVRSIKSWQDSLKEKDKGINDLADTLNADAALQAARDAAAAARAREDLARANRDAAAAALTVAQITHPTPPPVDGVPQPEAPEVVQAQTAVAEAEATLEEAVQATQQAVVYVTTVANRPLHTQSVDPAILAVRDAVYNPNAAPSHGGVAEVRRYTATLTRVNGTDGGIMDIFGQLRSTECETSANACVLGDAFANAIQQKMTVREAIESFKRGENAGMNPQGVFGFESQAKTTKFNQAIQPIFQTNFPYNSLVILRKYRVLPVSWELAALYIKDHQNACGTDGVYRSCTLQDMIDGFADSNSPFFRLVDPNWVLKMPSVYCALKGAGPIQQTKEDARQTICKSDTNGDGKVCCDKSCLTVETEKNACAGTGPLTSDCLKYLDDEEETAIRSEVCLDEQTCLEDDAQGKCAPKMYGYCLEEKKLWRFNGTQCDAVYASCDEFSEKGSTIANYYLKDSIVRPPQCDENTAGCQWYSKTRYVSAEKTAQVGLVREWSSAVAQRAYFTPKTAECSAQAEGCRGLVDVTSVSLDSAPAPKAMLIGYATWYGNNNPDQGAPTWTWLKNNNYFSATDIDITSNAEQLAAKNYDVYIIDNYAWGVGDASAKAYDLWKKYGKKVITIGNDSTSGAPYPITGYIYNNTGYDSTPDVRHSITEGHRSEIDIGSTGDVGNIITSVLSEFIVLYRKTSDPTKITGIIGENENGGIWFHDQTGYLTSNTRGQGVLTNVLKYMMSEKQKLYAKIAPDYYQCNDPENTVIDRTTSKPFTKPSYRREECKPFALHCSATYTGCELYTPQEAGGFPIAAKNPTAGCEEACAGLTSYSIQKTRLESQLSLSQTATSAAFIPSSPSVERCTVEQAGCDEFTNVRAGAEAEQRDYYKEIRWCEESLEHPPVFYSPIGSNLGGYALEKFIVKADPATGAPACFGGGTSCACSEDDYYDQFSNPNISTINCRQLYVNRGGKGFNPEYYQLDKLVYFTDDCKDYRRTLDGNRGTIYNISPSLSTSCPATFARCREFRDATAGNIVMVDYSNFEDGTANGWGATGADGVVLPSKASNESESLGNHSLEMKDNDDLGAVKFEKNGMLLLGNASYLIGLSMKVPGNLNTHVSIDLLGFDADVSSTPQPLPANTWQYLKFSFPKLQSNPVSQGNSGVRITITPDDTSKPISSVLLDSVTIKQADGVIFAIDDSWVLPDVCLADGGASGDKTNARLDQIGCKLYQDRSGAQAVFRDVERLCPNEMVGCKAYNVSTTPLYLIEDAKKSCSASDNGCTAYGVPKLNIDGSLSQRVLSGSTKTEDWIARYLKVSPDETDISKGVCSAQAVGCKAYQIGGLEDTYFMEPKNAVCRWRAAQDKDLTGTDDQKKEKKINGIWYYKTCSGNHAVACASDTDCSTISAGTCEETACAGSMPKSCPAGQKSCRKITDPECVQDRNGNGKLRRDYGRGTPDVSCQRDYYYLADAENRGECEGKVDVEAGCLLFHDANAGADKYTSAFASGSGGYYGAYFSQGMSGVYLNAAEQLNSPATNDANNLLKVRLDRTCKTWLECEGTVQLQDGDDKGKNICTGRVPCNQRGSDGSCVNYMYARSTQDDTGQKDAVLKHSTFNIPASVSAPIPFASLTGMARPDILFPAKGAVPSFNTSNALRSNNISLKGHNSLFKWTQEEGLGTAPSAGRLSLGIDNATTIDSVVASSCRIRPRNDAPEVRYSPKTEPTQALAQRIKPVDSCNYENKKGDAYKGVDGYCIEPYPAFTDTYAESRADHGSYGYRSACLNWYPSDRIKSAAAVGSTAGGGGLALAQAGITTTAEEGRTLSATDVYFCAEFGVREHEETMKNAAGTDVTSDIPKVDAIPGIGRYVFSCNPDGTNGALCRATAPWSGFAVVANSDTQEYKPATFRKDRITEFNINKNITDDAITTADAMGYPKTYTGNLASKGGNITDTTQTPQVAPTSNVIARIVETCETTTPGFDTTTGKCPNGTQMYKVFPAQWEITHRDKNGDPTGVTTPVEANMSTPNTYPSTPNLQPLSWKNWTTEIPYKPFKAKGADRAEVQYKAAVCLPDPATYTSGDDTYTLSTYKIGGCSNVVGQEDRNKENDTCDGEDSDPDGERRYWCPSNASRSCTDVFGATKNSVGWWSCANFMRVTCTKQELITARCANTNTPEIAYVSPLPANDEPAIARKDRVCTGGGGIGSSCTFPTSSDGSTPSGSGVESPGRDVTQTRVYFEQPKIVRVTTVEKKIVQEGGVWKIKTTPIVTLHQGTTNLNYLPSSAPTNAGTPPGMTALGITATEIKGRLVEVCTPGGYCAAGTSSYSDAQPRIDKVAYYGGTGQAGDNYIETFTRTGSVPTAANPACATSYNTNPSCGMTPLSEIAAGEARASDGAAIDISPRDFRPEKPAYTITAKATYRDVYCKRVVQVAVNGNSVPFRTKLNASGSIAAWGGASGSQLNTDQVKKITGEGGTVKGPIIFKSTILSTRWHNTQPIISSAGYGSDTRVWPANAATLTARYSYSSYDKGAKYTTSGSGDAKKYVYDWKKDGTHPYGDWTIGGTGDDIAWSDREAVQIVADQAAGSGKPLAGMTVTTKGPAFGSPLGYNPRTYNYLTRVILDSNITNTGADDGDNIGGDGASKINFSVTSFDYTDPPIGFARYYGQWKSVSGTSALTKQGTQKDWFFTRPGRKPNIYTAPPSGTPVSGSFTYEKISNAPNVRLTFYVDAHDDQLPLRRLIINWNDGSDPTELANSTVDGQGIGELPPVPPGGNKFEITHIFNNKKKSFVEDIDKDGTPDPAKICIEAMDNWEERTEICGFLENVSPDGNTHTPIGITTAN